MRTTIITVLIILFSVSTLAESREWRIKSIKENFATSAPFLLPTNTEIEFSNGHKAQTNVIEFQYIDSIDVSDNNYIIFSGRTCSECDMRTSIYISPTSKSEYSTERYGYPGKKAYYLDGTALEDSRMFYGECLEENEQTIVFFINYLGEDEKWHKSVYDVDFNNNSVVKNPTELSYDLLVTAERMVKNGICRELQGIDGYSEP